MGKRLEFITSLMEAFDFFRAHEYEHCLIILRDLVSRLEQSKAAKWGDLL